MVTITHPRLVNWRAGGGARSPQPAKSRRRCWTS